MESKSKGKKWIKSGDLLTNKTTTNEGKKNHIRILIGISNIYLEFRFNRKMQLNIPLILNILIINRHILRLPLQFTTIILTTYASIWLTLYFHRYTNFLFHIDLLSLEIKWKNVAISVAIFCCQLASNVLHDENLLKRK